MLKFLLYTFMFATVIVAFLSGLYFLIEWPGWLADYLQYTAREKRTFGIQAFFGHMLLGVSMVAAAAVMWED